MKDELIAVPVFQERVAPLLDVAEKFIIFELVDGEIGSRITVDIRENSEFHRIGRLREIGVSVIISGAVSGFVSRVIQEYGIRLVPWVSGSIEQVMELYLGGTLASRVPLSGGCGRRWRRWGSGKKEDVPENERREQ